MDLPDPGIKPGSPALQADSLPTELSGKPLPNTRSLLKKRKVSNIQGKRVNKKQKTLIIILTETEGTLHL